MTEKQTNKPTVRKVLGKAKVATYGSGDKYVFIGKHSFSGMVADLPVDTQLELVAILPAEPKRRLVKPEGIKIIGSFIHPDIKRILVDDLEVAIVSENTCRWDAVEECCGGTTLAENIQTAYRRFADVGIHGFCWENVEPDYWFYTVMADNMGRTTPPSDPKWQPHGDREGAQIVYDEAAVNWDSVMLLGFTRDMQVDILEQKPTIKEMS